ncbi:putative phage-related protein [Pseudomonas syringae pv. coriandricola]|uniref:Putative phage-related protein n=2 Tax=Pseudomonas syringae group genomosp. 3 TaxID=251701 RepID=A0A3M4UDV4_9PSED|nr:putative phage-related protein [Pseudomonas syringae pv. coriandricola]RMU08289.1 putative phage-related protein [Pseudomonas syringae pv. coriandricola]
MDSSKGRRKDMEKDEVTVIFGTRNSLRNPLPVNTILIVPSNDDWNDFGLRTRIDISICLSEHDSPYETAAFIGFITNSKDEANGVIRLEEMLEGTSNIELPATDAHRFFTMLPSMDAYRALVIKYGPAKTVVALKAMRDLVTLNEFKNTSNWLDLAAQSEVFLKSFIRNAESYFAYKNAGSILRGLEYEEFGKLSETLHIQFQLQGRVNPHELTFRFSHNDDLPKRIAVVIGKNGVGKSQTLGRIVRAALSGDSSLTDGNVGGRVLVNRVLAFAPTNETGSVFPGDRRKRPRVWYRRFSLNRLGRIRKGLGVADQVIQTARSNEYIGEVARWDIFLNAIKAIDNWEQLSLPIRGSRQEALSFRRMRQGGEQQIIENFASIDLRREPVRMIDGVGYPLSSGEISFVRFAAQASLHVENGSLLLLDEPETHLHPNFISQFVSLLNSLLVQTGSAAIIATHSAYFVREVFQEQVSVLRTDKENFVTVERPMLRTFGADVGAISYFVFGEDEPSQLASALEAKLLRRFSTWDALYHRYKSELSLEVLGALRESMERKSLE